MRIELLMAWPHRYEQRWVDVDEGATVADALAQAAWGALPDVAGYALHGRRVTLETTLGRGDRLELLRALEIDPKEARRRRAASTLAGSKPGRE